MAIEQRGNSFRAKVFDGKQLVVQRTFGTRAEADHFHKVEKAKLTVRADLADWTVSPEQHAAAAKLGTVAVPAAIGRIFWDGWHVDQNGNKWREPGWDVDRESTPKETPKSTLGEITARYRNEVTPTKRGATQETSKIDGILLKHKLTKRRMTDLRKRDFQSYRDERLKEVSPSTVKKDLNLWHAIIEYARDEWEVDLPENPASVRQPQGANIARDRRLHDGEEEHLLAAADPLMHDAIIIAIDTAMRQGEILKLRPSMMRYAGTTKAYVALPREITKSGKPRDVPLTLRGHDVLVRRASLPHREVDALLFPVTSNNAFKMNFRRTTKRAKIADLRFHDLRHEATSRLFEAKVYQQAEVMKITGHESDAMVRRYLKTSGVELATRRRQL